MIKMSKAKGYSLWLIPSGNAYNRLENIISELSKQYSAPFFEPHVTLIGGIKDSEENTLSKTSQLANSVRPFRVTLTEVQYLDEYFKSLFIRAKETDELMKANSKARETFNLQNDSDYMPHLSLMYSNSPTRIKEEIIEKIGKDIAVKFDVKNIHLFSTEGEVGDWYKIKKFDLKK